MSAKFYSVLCSCHVGVTYNFILVQRGAPSVVASHCLQDMASLDSSFIIVDEDVLPTVTSPEIKQSMTESKSDEPVGDSTTLGSAPRVDNHQ